MTKMSTKKAGAISTGVFLISLGAIVYTGFWWPGILLALAAMLGIRQYLTERYFDMVVTLIILLGVFLTTWLQVTWDVLVPIVFVLGGIYVIYREYVWGE
ncbi:MAG: hypothetical protein KDK65_00710 [Chlamydiia bacterium]|nr:hypothetical protein [Chlamydiia bacterium]